MQKEKDIKHKTQKEIEDEVGMTLQSFEANKTFNEETPLQFTNKVVIKEMKKEAEEKDPKNKYDERAFVSAAVRLYQTDYPKYRQHLEAAGYIYQQ